MYLLARLAYTHTHSTSYVPTIQLQEQNFKQFSRCLGWTSRLLTACDSPLLPGEAPSCLRARWENSNF